MGVVVVVGCEVEVEVVLFCDCEDEASTMS